MRTKDEAKRRAIIDKTLDIVQEEGIAGLKMAVLARQVGIAPGTLYLYYRSKEALIVSIYTELFEEYSLTVYSQMAKDLPYKKRIKKRLVELVQNEYRKS